MKNCPNCGFSLSGQEKFCPNCGFNVEKYRQDYLNKQAADLEKTKTVDNLQKIVNTEQTAVKPETEIEANPEAKKETKLESKPELSRSAYRKESKTNSVENNPIVEGIIKWLRDNTTIAFLVAVGLLIVMSFSRPLGWILFVLAMGFLVWAGHKAGGQYTADRNLTDWLKEKFSKVFNAFDSKEDELEEKNEEFIEAHPQVEKQVEEVKEKVKKPHKFTVVQLSIYLTSAITLILLFMGTGFVTSKTKLTVASVFFEVANKQISAGNFVPALILYLTLAILLLMPIFIMLAVSQKQTWDNVKGALYSVFESGVLIYLFYRLSQATATDSYMGQAVSSLKNYAVAIGVSGYLLIMVSILTTILTIVNIVQQLQNKQDYVE